MTTRQEEVRRWIQAGLIDASTGDRILAFEAATSAEDQARSWRPSVTELLVYLAAAITAAGVAVLAATNWEHLASPARVAVPGISAAAVCATGLLLLRTRNDAMGRAASLLWLLAGVLIAGTAAIAAGEAGWSENEVALTSGTVAVIASVFLWAPMRMHPQIIGMGGAAFLFSTAISARFADDWVVAVLGVSLALFGLVALIATESRLLVPASSAGLLAGVALAAGAFFAGMPPSPPVHRVACSPGGHRAHNRRHSISLPGLRGVRRIHGLRGAAETDFASR